ncbi:hypothetical protein GCM10010251_85390 [Streptomyces aurantiogriseus]|uniref:Uncharacterized protein n=1 Tax=Streptomyces aurantiogriseus TaxID=66870 RepID=A0A918FMJ7_9ACTN|nr:hypothetical protein GCM10010251_85390 [Streptomyces aurantiogriseus]
MNIPNLAWYHQSIFEGTVYASAAEGHKTCGSPKAATPPARAAAFIRERLLREAEDMVRLHVSRGGMTGRWERNADMAAVLRVSQQKTSDGFIGGRWWPRL